jgi:hypothetical protein
MKEFEVIYEDSNNESKVKVLCAYSLKEAIACWVRYNTYHYTLCSITQTK